jgi:hypothetical protein
MACWRTNSLTTLEEPFRASLCTLEESLLDDFDLEDVFGWDMAARGAHVRSGGESGGGLEGCTQRCVYASVDTATALGNTSWAQRRGGCDKTAARLYQSKFLEGCGGLLGNAGDVQAGGGGAGVGLRHVQRSSLQEAATGD